MVNQNEATQLKRISFCQVLWLIIQITFSSFGGGNALLPNINQIAVKKRQWITEAEFQSIIISSNLLPGPNVIQVLSYIAIKKIGFWKGMLVTFIGILPHIGLAIGIYYGLTYLPIQYLLIVNVAILIAISGILLGFIINYCRLWKQNPSYHWSQISLMVFSAAFCFFVPSPFNIPAFIIIGVLIAILITISYRKRKRKH